MARPIGEENINLYSGQPTAPEFLMGFICGVFLTIAVIGTCALVWYGR